MAINQSGITMGKYVLLVSEGIKYWSLMTWENYTARIRDGRKLWTFDGANGFESTEDVLAYVEQYFKINRNDIEVV